MGALGEQRGCSDLLKQVKIVVGGNPIGAEGYIHARFDHFHHIGNAAAELQVADRTMDGGDTAFGQQLHILRLQPDTVGGNGAAVPHMMAVENLCRCQTIALLALFVLVLCL